MKKQSLNKAFTYLESGPVVLVTTNDAGINNVMTISWHMPLDFQPDCHIALVTGDWNHSFKTMMRAKECVICIPPAKMSDTVVKIGMYSGEEIDKFRKFSLTALDAEKVSAPLIKECIACLECEVSDYIADYNIVVLHCVNLWVNKDIEFAPTLHANGDGTFRVLGEKVLNYRRTMAGKYPVKSKRF